MTRQPQSQRLIPLVALAIALAGAIGFAGYWFGANRPAGQMAAKRAAANGEILYWYDPMVPDQHFDRPGKSPFMDMQLVARHAGDAEALPGVKIDPAALQNLGVRLAVVRKETLRPAILASGVIDYNQRDVAIVQARQGGFVERARGRAVGDIVIAGEPLAELRVPEWSGAIAEYLALRSNQDAALTGAARQRLAMLGVPTDILHGVEASGVAPSTFTIRAPISGALTTFDLREGMTVASGATMASLNGVATVWLTVSVPQGASQGLHPGAHTVAHLTAYRGEDFDGVIESILPMASTVSRAVEVRVSLRNADRRLRPGMTGEVSLSGPEVRDALLIPSEAVIRSGSRTLVIAVETSGRFTPTEVTAGLTTADQTQILTGLVEGQKIVASGQFLIDSEATLSGVVARLSAAPQSGYTSKGKVTQLSADGVTIAHEPVPGLGWPAMTMKFAWGSGGKQAVAVGDPVAFSFKQGSAGYVIETITREGAGQ